MLRHLLATLLLTLALLGLAAPPAGAAPKPGQAKITYIFYDGTEYRTEGDEYAVVTNVGGQALALKGYRLYAGDPGQNFYFGAVTLKAGASYRVYTNRTVKGAGSFKIGRAIWNNKGDCGTLYNAKGKQVSQYCY